MNISGDATLPKLIVGNLDGSIREPVTIGNAGITIGRVAGNDIVIDEPRVSRRHARIDWDGRQVTVTDLGSSNGTTIGMTRLTPNTAYPWSGFEMLSIGPFPVTLMLPAADTAVR